MIKKGKWIGILSGVCALSLYLGARSAVHLQADASQEAMLWNGFAITATAVRMNDPVGLRFKTDVERLTPVMKKYNPNAEYYTTLTFTRSDGQEFAITRSVEVWRPDGNGWNTVLLSIPESDYATEITAQSFIKLNGRETAFYQTEPVTISIAQTAAAAISYGTTSEYLTQYVDEQVFSITMDKTSASMEEGQTLQLNATTAPVQCMAKWTSSDTSVATVDNKGKVKAKSVGETIITAEINGYTAICEINVTQRDETITAFATQAKVGSYNKMSIAATWLNNLFADERVDGFTFTMNATRATTLKAVSIDNEVSLKANTNTTVTFTRSMYEAWRASATSNFEYKGTSILSSTITLSNFKKVWAIEERQTLTAKEVETLNGLMPDYSSNSYSFEFYAYNSLTNGEWSEYDEDGNKVATHNGGEDFRNAYRIEEYKDAGMSILLPQTACSISASLGNKFDFKSSELKRVMDQAASVGLKVIVSDYRLYTLVEETSIVGENKTFATQADLDKQVQTYMQAYASHPAFYGVQLLDEPNYTQFTAQGEVYKSIKRCYANAFVQMNLLPPMTSVKIGENGAFPTPSAETLADYQALGYGELAERFAAFDTYLNTFLDATGADYIMYDQYPLSKGNVNETYIGGLQVAASVAGKRGVELRLVSQIMSFESEETQRLLTEEDLRWLNNLQLGFGVKQLSYYAYFTLNNGATMAFLDGASFITRTGEKTDIYYAMREILAENQAFASTILSFDYQASATYTATCGYDNKPANVCADNVLAKVQSVDVNQESTLITQLYDKNSDKYMYMVQNLVDPLGGTVVATQTVKLTFNENYEYAIVWKNGEQSVVRLENNTYIVKLNAGEAVYVIAFNPAENDDGGFVFDKAQGDNGIWFFDEENWK